MPEHYTLSVLYQKVHRMCSCSIPECSFMSLNIILLHCSLYHCGENVQILGNYGGELKDVCKRGHYCIFFKTSRNCFRVGLTM